MGRVIVVTSGKGGVGKSTTTANLGMALAQRNKRVAVVDADFGLRNLDLLLGLENRIVYTAVEVLAGECRLEQALVKDKRRPNLVLLPAAQNRTKDAVNPAQMRQLILRSPRFTTLSWWTPRLGSRWGFRMRSVRRVRRSL